MRKLRERYGDETFYEFKSFYDSFQKTYRRLSTSQAHAMIEQKHMDYEGRKETIEHFKKNRRVSTSVEKRNGRLIGSLSRDKEMPVSYMEDIWHAQASLGLSIVLYLEKVSKFKAKFKYKYESKEWYSHCKTILIYYRRLKFRYPSEVKYTKKMDIYNSTRIVCWGIIPKLIEEKFKFCMAQHYSDFTYSRTSIFVSMNNNPAFWL